MNYQSIDFVDGRFCGCLSHFLAVCLLYLAKRACWLQADTSNCLAVAWWTAGWYLKVSSSSTLNCANTQSSSDSSLIDQWVRFLSVLSCERTHVYEDLNVCTVFQKVAVPFSLSVYINRRTRLPIIWTGSASQNYSSLREKPEEWGVCLTLKL